MIKKLGLLVVLALSLLVVAAPARAAFDPFGEVCSDSDTTAATVCSDKRVVQTTGNNRIYGRNGVITVAINIVSTAIGIGAVAMVILGGLRYITAGGDSNKIAQARRTLTYALVGVVVAIFAQGLIRLVFNRL